jgi:hypothetical protein
VRHDHRVRSHCCSRRHAYFLPLSAHELLVVNVTPNNVVRRSVCRACSHPPFHHGTHFARLKPHHHHARHSVKEHVPLLGYAACVSSVAQLRPPPSHRVSSACIPQHRVWAASPLPPNPFTPPPPPALAPHPSPLRCSLRAPGGCERYCEGRAPAGLRAAGAPQRGPPGCRDRSSARGHRRAWGRWCRVRARASAGVCSRRRSRMLAQLFADMRCARDLQCWR